MVNQVVRETFAYKYDDAKPKRKCKVNACEGMFNWFKILRKLSDTKLIEINGIDYTLYLIFLRYSAIYFACLTLFNLVCMIPIYATGDPIISNEGKSQLNSTMDKITLTNITAKHGKMAFSYFA